MDEDDHTVFRSINGTKKYFAPGEFIQPLGSMEVWNAVGGLYDSQNIVQVVWLNSNCPITKESVKNALWLISRQIPHLQFCLARRGLKLWFKRMKTLVLDFEEISGDVMKVVETMLETKYDLWNGPLWKVRMIQPKHDHCNEKKCSFNLALVLSIQHAIADSTTNMRICREVVRVLNELGSGNRVVAEPVSLSLPMDEFFKNSFKWKYIIKSAFRALITNGVRNFSSKTSFGGLFPIPQTKNAKTEFLFDELTQGETTALIGYCRAAKITVHSCIITLANLALLQTAQSKSSLPLGEMSFKVMNSVNMRKYYPEEYMDTTGSHSSMFEINYKMSLSQAQNFWNHAIEINKIKRKELEVKNNHVNVIPLLKLAALITPTNAYLSKKGYKIKTECHYYASNMGNLKELLPGPKEEENIEITYVLRCISSTLTGNPFLLNFHTFRDKFLISMDYFTNKMSKEIAEEFFTTLCTSLRNICRNGSITNDNVDDEI